MTLLKLLPSFIRRKVEDRPDFVKILDNIGWLFFDKILRMGVGLLVGVWMARYLGPEQFGQLSYAIAFVGLFGAIAGMGLNDIVVRDIVRVPVVTHTTLGTSFVLQVFGSLISVVLIVGVISWLRPDDTLTKSMVVIMGLSLVFKSTEVVKYWFESQVQSRYTVWIENGAFIIMAGIKVVMILWQAPLIAFVWTIFAEAILVAVGLLSIYAKSGGHLTRWQPRIERARTLLKDSWPLVLSSIAIVIYMRIDQVMLGEMLGTETVGIYNAAARLSEVWYFIPMSIVSSVFPAILKAKATSEELYLTRLQKLYDFLSFLSFIVAVIVTIVADRVVLLLYGRDYYEAGAILSVQIWAGIFVAMGVARGKWLLAENLQHVGYWYIGIAMIVNIAGNLILIPILGVIGSAVATVLAQATTAIIAPALFTRTRFSVIMLIRSLNPLKWLRMF